MLVKGEKVTLPLLINSLNVDRCKKMDETHNASEKGNVTRHFVLGHLEKKRTVLSLATNNFRLLSHYCRNNRDCSVGTYMLL